MSNDSLEISNEGRKLIKNWDNQRKECNRIKENLKRQEDDKDNAADDILKWLSKGNNEMKIGTVVLMPVHETFLRIEVEPPFSAFSPIPKCNIEWVGSPPREGV